MTRASKVVPTPRLLAALAAAAASLTFASAAHATDYCTKFSASDPVPAGSVQSYLTIANASASDTRASYTNAGNGWVLNVDLKGYLFMPSSSAFAPGIVYSHGGSNSAKPPCAVVEFFVSRGYVFFAPLRRGEAPSTGLPLSDWQAANPGESEVEYFKIQAADILSATVYVRNLPSVFSGRVALMGHSSGAIISLLANQKVGSGPLYFAPHHAVVDISGGTLGWDTSLERQEAMLAAVADSLRPMFFLQAKNEPSNATTPLDDLATMLSIPHEATIYPNVPNATHQQAHNRMVNDPVQVAQWGPDAVLFLQTY